VDAVVAAGGDGTINEVANALTGGPLPLGIIPLGTANVLAMELGIGPTAEAAAAAIAGGQCLTISPGLVNGRQFLLMAGVGVDAEVVAGVDLALKRRAGKLAYVAQAVITALRYGYPPLTVSVDSVDHQAYGVVVCNGRHYGGRYIVAPAARLDQEGFAVCLFGRPGPVGSLRAGAALLQGRLSSLPEVTLLPGRHVAITGNTHGAVQADGDLVARLPAEITVAEHKLQVLVPRR
jgi:diacylglycerol kinase family enzyme